MLLDRIGEIAKKVAIIVAIVLVLYLIIAEAGLKKQPMAETIYDVVSYEQTEKGYMVDYKDEDGNAKTIVCKTMVKGDEKELRIKEREYWGFSEREGTLVLPAN